VATVRKKRRGYGALTIYETLRDEILSLELEPGILIDEASLALRFEVSRSPVREAMVRLVSESLLQTLPNKGTIVTPLRVQEFPQYVDALDLVQRAATRLAARLHSKDALALIVANHEAFRSCVSNGDVLGMIQSNRDFHVAIGKATNNRYLEDAYSQLLDDGRRFLRLYFKSYGDTLPHELVEAHDEMIAAIQARDELRAEKLASKHTDEMQQQFLTYLGKRNTNDIPV